MSIQVCEHQTVRSIGLMVESVRAGTLDLSCTSLEIVHVEVKVDERGILGPTRGSIIFDAHELDPSTLATHAGPFVVVYKSDFSTGDLGIEGSQSSGVRAGESH